jgi:hypothetical protein
MRPALAAACLVLAGGAEAAPPRTDAPPPPQLVAPGVPATSAGTSAEAAPAPGQPASAPAAARAVVAAASDAVPSTEPRVPGEPEVKHIVVQDDHTRIEELRVRGVPQRIVVTSKVGGKDTSYEIITGDGSRDLSFGANTSRGATGKRVWRVLNF